MKVVTESVFKTQGLAGFNNGAGDGLEMAGCSVLKPVEVSEDVQLIEPVKGYPQETVM